MCIADMFNIIHGVLYIIIGLVLFIIVQMYVFYTKMRVQKLLTLQAELQIDRLRIKVDSMEESIQRVTSRLPPSSKTFQLENLEKDVL